MNDDQLYQQDGWQWCTAEGAELHTLLQGLRSSFREKLEWLEEAETLTLRLHGQAARAATSATALAGQVAEDARKYGAGGPAFVPFDKLRTTTRQPKDV